MKQSEDKSEATRGAVGNTASKVRCVDHETHKATASDVEQITDERQKRLSRVISI